MKTEETKQKKSVSGKGSQKTGKAPSGKKTPKKPANKKPWEQQSAAKKPAGAKKEIAEFRSFLYLLPKKISAKELAKALDFIPAKEIEVWEEECVLEINTPSGTVTFEDIRDSLGKEDREVLSNLRMKQVIACDYESVTTDQVRKIMNVFLEKFHGSIGSDTEDFAPFLKPEEL